jgi:hypothetical protein
MLTRKSAHTPIKQDMRGHDFSGTDLEKLQARDYNFFEAIFAGCSIRGWRIAESIFQHTDFAEARLEDCRFEESSFDHADFVGTEIRNTLFRRCSFQNGEWRDVTFINVQFVQCVFRNTTTSLARFIRCDFDRSSSNSFASESKRYNVFADTKFYLDRDKFDFLKLNFGIRAETFDERFDADMVKEPLFGAAVDYYGGAPVTGRLLRKLITAIDSMARESPPTSLFRLKYSLDIYRTFIDAGEISIFAIQYTHDHVMQSIETVRDSVVLLEFVAFLALLRLKLRERIDAAESNLASVDDITASLIRLHFEFAETYSRENVRLFANTLAQSLLYPVETVHIERYQAGSTIVDLLMELAAPLVEVVRFIYYYLPKATVTVESAAKLKEASTALVKRAPKEPEVAENVARAKKSRSGRKRTGPAGDSGSSTALTVPALEVLKPATGETKQVQVVVSIVRDQVLAVGGTVEVRVLLQ